MRSTLDPTLDVVFKLLLTRPKSQDILIALLTAVLRPAKPIVKVKILNSEMPKEGEPEKGIWLDIAVELEDGTRLDIEMQCVKRPAFRLRALYYWARLFGSQLQRGEEYQALRPVISILFLDYQDLACSRLHSVFKVLEVHNHEVFSPALEIHVIELPKRMRLDNQAEAEQDLVRWTRFLKASTDEEAQEVAKEDAMIAKANAILKELSADPAAQELARQRQLALDSYRIELAAAKEEGKKDGLEEGEAKGLRNAIVAMCELLGIELGQERMNTLQALGVTELSELMQQIKQLRAWPNI